MSKELTESQEKKLDYLQKGLIHSDQAIKLWVIEDDIHENGVDPLIGREDCPCSDGSLLICDSPEMAIRYIEEWSNAIEVEEIDADIVPVEILEKSDHFWKVQCREAIYYIRQTDYHPGK